MKSLFAEKLDSTSKLHGGGMVCTAGNCVIFRDEGNGPKDERRKRKEMMMTNCTAFPIGQWLWHLSPIVQYSHESETRNLVTINFILSSSLAIFRINNNTPYNYIHIIV